jgi:PadR family transcriptional regulator AphA
MTNKQLSIEPILLGLLQQKPQSGYDLKKAITESPLFFWSGNNNQIYTSLIQLHREGLVTYIEDNEHRIPRKVYSLTEKGSAELAGWVAAPPALPQLKNSFMLQLLFSDCISKEDRQALIESYEQEVTMKLLMTQEEKRRHAGDELLALCLDNLISFYANERDWIQHAKQAL